MKLKIDETIHNDELDVITKLKEIKANNIVLSNEKAKEYYDKCLKISQYYKRYTNFLDDFVIALEKIIQEKKEFLLSLGVNYDTMKQEREEKERKEVEELKKQQEANPLFQLHKKYPDLF